MSLQVPIGAGLRAYPWPAAAMFLWLAVGLPASALAQQVCANPVARIESARNGVQVVSASARVSQQAVRRAPVCAGDRIQVADNSRAVIVILTTNTPIAIDQNTEFIVNAAPATGNTLLNLVRGALLYLARVRRGVEIRTPFVNASIEGTEFVVRVLTDRTVISVYEGAVRAANSLGDVLINAGEESVTLQGQAPQRPIVIRSRDAVQWALYYQPLLPPAPFAELALNDTSPAALVRRAALYLSVGRLTDARDALNRVLPGNPQDPATADGYVLQTVVAIALNDKTGALANGDAAVARAPQFARAHVALSYALQSNFQLDAARDAAQRAVDADRTDGAAWARLAELRLMLDDIGGAADAAREATGLAPQLARAHVADGFTRLAQLALPEAEAAFEQAVTLEPDNPTARLGLGVTKIRRGRLSAGRSDIELAAAFNAADPLVRSYLGKAYFDERRDALAAEEFATAQKLDDQDPTPWFYDAIREQSLNQPVAALSDLQRSIALNGHRAVYRSRFLLDQDLAARSASLGRLYRDLGFEQLALVEAWRSVEAEPADHAGHRFLADTYSTLPRHEVARVSELLQAQLLQPINLTPVSPRLAETDLFFLEGTGPDAPAFNEFNPLFGRNRLAVQVSGAGGNEGVAASEVTVSGVWNKLSFSAGQFHYGSDGFRVNNGQRRDIANAFFQASLSPATSVQAEYRHERHRFGDLFVNFDPTDFIPEQTTRIDGDTLRLGGKHTFSPRSSVIGSVYWRTHDVHFDETEVNDRFGFTSHVRNARATDGYTAEVRHFLRLDRVSVTSGAGRFRSTRGETSMTRVEFDAPVPTLDETNLFSDRPEQTNVYAYAIVDRVPNLTITVGASGDFFQQQFFERNQFNPKLGLAWRVTPATTVRAAAFRTLHRSVVSSQTIEPTAVAGFSQLFADAGGTEARRYGAAIDQKFGSRVFGGVEYSFRDLRVPIEFEHEGGAVTVARVARDERFGRAYVYCALPPSLSAGVSYVYERFGGDPAATVFEQVTTVTTHRVPLDIRYFSPAGISAGFRAEFLDQNGIFAFETPGEDRFWVLDASVGYRLPRHYGRLTFEVANLLGKQFNYQDTDPSNPRVRAGRLAVLRFTVGM